MIFPSPYPDVVIPETTVTTHVFGSTEESDTRTALIDGPTGATTSYGELAGAIRRAAGGLAARGFAKGDVLGIYSPNTVLYPIAFHGAAYAGGVVTTVNPHYTAGELASQLRDAGARFLVTTSACVEKTREAAEEAGGIEKIFSFDDAPGTTPFSALTDGAELAEGPQMNPSTDLVALPYSSGTTGGSKGVMLTHRNLVANMVQLDGTESQSRGLTEDDTVLAILPFFHIYGLLVIMNWALSHGARIVVLPRFELETFLGAVQDYGVTYLHLVPPILLALAKHPVVDQYDLSSLRWLMSGAAPLGKDVAEACAKRLDCLVLQGYGLTETSPVSHCNQPDPEKIKVGSVGPCIAGTECKIVDPSSGEELGPNEEGEIWIRGPQVMKGYLNKPDATAECIDADGFFHTGDVGYADEDGYFFIVDRLKELIKYKGMQVAPAELEALLLSHPSVSDAAVIPKPDEEAGEIPKACVVLRGEIDAQTLQNFIAERVAPHKKIREVEFVDQIPKSPSGKILRRVLVERERLKAAP